MLEKVCNIITGGAMGKIIKDTIHANGIDIGIYIQDFENEFISLTDIALFGILLHFLDWLSRQSKVLSVLPWAHISK